MKNIALKRIPNHCILTNYNTKDMYHSSIASCSSQKLLACNCLSGLNSRAK